MDINLTQILLVVIAVAGIVIVIMQAITRTRTSAQANLGQAVRDDLRNAREESAGAARVLREEIRDQLHQGNDALARGFSGLGVDHNKRMDIVDRALNEFGMVGQGAHERIQTTLEAGLQNISEVNDRKAEEMRREAAASNKSLVDLLSQHLQVVATRVEALVEGNASALNSIREVVDARIKELQTGVESKVTEMRGEVTARIKEQDEHLVRDLSSSKESQREYLEKLLVRLGEVGTTIQSSLETVRTTIDGRLITLTTANQEAFDRVSGAVNQGMSNIQTSNEKKLEEMRATVDEKLQSTLEKRLGESFKMVSDRLEAVHQGLGEMQTLAAGVGDLKRVLSNVKVRGTWAEVQLGAILEQVLTPEQYAKNVAVKPNSAERVEFAIKLPGSGNDADTCMWLPIDSKFPQEDYVRLQEASEKGDAEGQRKALDALTRAIRIAAKDISDKYVAPPYSTDFGIMFLPTEGLYAEIVRQSGLIEELQQKHRVVVVGPSNLAAFLCSIRMGFQSIAIQRRADDVWKVLGAVKTEFGKFGGVMERVRRQLEAATRTVEETQVRTRAMERNLRDVQALPEDQAQPLLMLSEVDTLLPAGDATDEVPTPAPEKELTSRA